MAFTGNLGLCGTLGRRWGVQARSAVPKGVRETGRDRQRAGIHGVTDVAVWLAIKTKLGLRDGSVTSEMKTKGLPQIRFTI